MRSPLSKILLPLALALSVAAMSPAAATASETVAPLPESNYAVRRACGQPAPDRAECMALQLVPVTAEASARRHPIGANRLNSAGPHALAPRESGFGLGPQDLRSAYALTEPEASGTQTIALVDAYNDPRAEADLGVFSKEFGLPECTKANGCLRQVSQTGSESSLPFPKTMAELKAAEAGTTQQREEAREAVGWGIEISLDIETAHAICQHCRLILVEANTPADAELFTAESTAVSLGATEISNSWGFPDGSISPSVDNSLAFDHPGVVITASSGDYGYRNWIWAAEAEEEFSAHEEEVAAKGKTVTAEERTQFNRELQEVRHADYPAASPHVVAVGGTRLTLSQGSSWAGESVWNGSGAAGGGCSSSLTAPTWQQQLADWSAVGCESKRAVADIAADADPYTGVAVTYSGDPTGTECRGKFEGNRWCTYGGTSLASPIIAAVFALAGGANAVQYPASTLYATRANAPGDLHDVTTGSNGECGAPFVEETGLSSCSAAAEAAASCGGALACLTAAGYDGPSGVGTPDGVLGFVPGQHEVQAPEATAATGGGGEAQRAAPAPPPATTAVPAVSAPAVKLTALALTAPALTALSRHRATARSIAFAFVLNVAARVRVTLKHRVRSHGHARWVAVGQAATIAAAAGRNVRRLSGASRLPKGAYSLTLTPLSGASRSISFTIR